MTLNDRTVITLLLIAYWALCLSYPRMGCWIIDEIGYINQAVVYSKGAVSAEGAQMRVPYDFKHFIKERHVTKRNPGRSLLNLPFYLSFGIAGVLFVSLLTQTGIFFLAVLLLRHFGVPPIWASLTLFNPILVHLSQACFGDLEAGFFLLGAAYALLVRKSGLLAGVFLGMAVIFRYHAALSVALVVFYLFFLFPRDEWKIQIRNCLSALAPFAIGLIVYNLHTYDHLIGPITRRSLYLAERLPENLFHVLVILNVYWPLMLFAVATQRNHIARLATLVALPLILLLSFYDKDLLLVLKPADILGGLGARLLTPTIPLLTVAYSVALFEVFRRLKPSVATRNIAMLGLMVAIVGVNFVWLRQKDKFRLFFPRVEAAVREHIPKGSVIKAERRVYIPFAVARDDESGFDWTIYETLQDPPEEESYRTTASRHRVFDYIAKIDRKPSPPQMKECETWKSIPLLDGERLHICRTTSK